MYDIIILGGGPGGLSCAIYALRGGKKVLLIEKYAIGGQAGTIYNIENYPGFESINGFDLSMNMYNQAKNLGLDEVYEEVVDADLNEEVKIIKTHKNTYEAKVVVIALGASARQLNLNNEKSFIGKGLSYCATCDGNFFKNKTVCVVGGGNTSFEDCLYLSNICKKIYLIHRRNEFRGSMISQNKIIEMSEGENAKIEMVLNSVVEKINGTDAIESLTVKNKLTDELREIKTDGLFVAIGRKPDTEIFKDKLNMDNNGYIITDNRMCTNIEGVFACGDVRNTVLRQVVTACSDGAISATSAIQYLAEN